MTAPFFNPLPESEPWPDDGDDTFPCEDCGATSDQYCYPNCPTLANYPPTLRPIEDVPDPHGVLS